MIGIMAIRKIEGCVLSTKEVDQINASLIEFGYSNNESDDGFIKVESKDQDTARIIYNDSDYSIGRMMVNLYDCGKNEKS